MGNIVRSRSRVYKLVIAIGLFAQLALLSWPAIAGAEPPPMTWSWTNADPVVFSSTPILDTSSSTCAGRYQRKNIIGLFGTREMCMTVGEGIRYGTSYMNNRFPPFVGFGYDDNMYKLTGTVCEYIDSCVYLPRTDTLATKQYLTSNRGRALVVYKNFSQRITKVLSELTPTFEYHFDSSNPDLVFRDPSGYLWSVGGIGASPNGDWLAVEIQDRGMNLMNMKTFEIKRISLLKFSYWIGRNPSAELVVSNDGNHVAVMGLNAGLTVFDVDSSCGDTLADEASISEMRIVTPCQTARIYTDKFIRNMDYAFRPRFDQDGGELTFHAVSYRGEKREVSLRASGYAGQRLDYLALGDSFSSGEGETQDKYYLDGTNDEYEKCHTSTRSYPYLIASELGIDAKYMKSVACSGALTGDVVGQDKLYWGQGERLGDKILRLDEIAKTMTQTSAKDLFIPGRVHQIAFIERYRPKAITIGIGGNDVGFMLKLRSCIGKGTCTWAGTAIGREKTALEIRALFGTLVAAYTELHEVSPNTKIYAVGYPKVIDPQGECGLISSSLLDSAEKQFMDEGIVYINKIVAAAAQAAGVKYIDIENSFAGSRLCGADTPSVMNGITLGDDFGISDKTKWFKVIGQEGFHPRPTGHAMTSKAILKSVPNIMTYEYCPDAATLCPKDISAPFPTGYWLVDGTTHGYASQRLAYFTQDREGSADGRQKTIALSSYSFAPNSIVKSEIQSEPVALGEFTAGADGSLRFDVKLPQDLPEGFHTIHLHGTSYSGEAIDLYEVIRYELPTVADRSLGQTSSPPKATMTNVTSSTPTESNTIKTLWPDSLSSPTTKDTAEESVKGVSISLADTYVTDDDARGPAGLLFLSIGLASLVGAWIWVGLRSKRSSR